MLEDEEGCKEEVQSRLSQAAADWNYGDLDRFVSIYHGSETTALYTSTEIFTGLNDIRRAYERSFTGHLSLHVLQVHCFNDVQAHVIVRLDQEVDKSARFAHVSLLMRRIHNRWYVVIANIPDMR